MKYDSNSNLNYKTYSRTHLALGACTLAVACLLTACGGADGNKQGPTVGVESTASLLVRDGYLVFKDQRQFENAIENMRSMSNTQQLQWRGQHSGFMSMAEAFKNLRDQVNSYADKVEASGKLITDKDDIFLMSEVLGKYGNIAYFDEQDNERSLERKIKDPGLALLVNQNGLVEVDGKLFQYTDDTHRRIVSPGNYSKLLTSKMCPLDPMLLKIGGIGKNRCNPNDDPDDTGGSGSPKGGSAEENDGYTLSSVSPGSWKTNEGNWMNFGIFRRMDNPSPKDWKDSYYSFDIGSPSDSANKDDWSKYEVTFPVEIVRKNDKLLFKVPPGTVSFGFNILTISDNKKDDRETLTFAVGPYLTSTAEIHDPIVVDPQLPCPICQKSSKSFSNTVKKDRLTVTDTLNQIAINKDTIRTTHHIVAKSEKKRLSGVWVEEDADINISSTAQGQGYDTWGSAGVTDGPEVTFVWYNNTDKAMDEAPHLKEMSIYATRTGGASGVAVSGSYQLP